MSLADPRVALEQMRSHAEEAVALLRGKTLRDLHTDRTLSLAILRLLEIVGEEIVWTVVHQDLPALARSLSAILGDR